MKRPIVPLLALLASCSAPPSAVDSTVDDARGPTSPSPRARFATLTIVNQGTGGGTITSDPAGIECGATCSMTVIVGTPVLLVASADNESRFAGFEGIECEGSRRGLASACTITLVASAVVTGTFDLEVTAVVNGGTPTPASSVPVGKIDATFNVDSNGQAVYSIPIKVPPGTSGVEPRLSLEYRSNTPNGLAGVGWSLGGLTSVRRCQSNYREGIEALANAPTDRFCLNGQRLVRFSGDGGDGSMYALERDDFTHLISRGDCNGGPCYFIGYTKNGTMMELGRTADSAVPGSILSHPFREWAVNKVVDTRSNAITFTYDSAKDHIYPILIEYTSNDRVAGGDALRKVELTYENRPDDEVTFFGTNRKWLGKRLKEIRTYIATPRSAATGARESWFFVKKYILEYELGAGTLRSRLSRLNECSTSSGCTGFSTRFVYQDNDFTFGPTDVVSEQVSQLPFGRIHNADFNADGYTDTFVVKQGAPYAIGTIEVTLTTINEGAPVIFEEPPSAVVDDHSCSGCWQHRVYYFADFNGDQKDDFLTHVTYTNPDADTNSAQIYVSNGDGTFTHWYTFGDHEHVNGRTRYFIGDYDGDARADVLVSPDGRAFEDELKNGEWGNGPAGWQSIGWKLFLSDGTGLSQAAEDAFPSAGERIHTGDFNGDGRTDFIITADREIWSWIHGAAWPVHIFDGFYTFMSNGRGFDALGQTTPGWGYDEKLTLGDFNGDSQTDIVVTSETGAWPGYRLVRSNSGVFDLLLIGPHFTGTDVLAVADFNGDHRADITDGSAYYLSDGKTFTWHNTGTFGDRVFTGDFNGDGMADMIVHQDNWVEGPMQPPDWIHTVMSKGELPDLLAEIHDSIGGVVEVDYLPLTNPEVYERTGGDALPHAIVQNAFHVVSGYRLAENVQRQDVPELTNIQAFSYKYYDLHVDLHGRGLLGFQTIDFVDGRLQAEGQATRTRTRYHTYFPFTGLVMRQMTYTYPADEMIFERVTDYWTSGGFPRRVELRGETETQYSGGTSETRAKSYTYDSYQNVRTLGDLGSTATSNDDVYIHTEYLNDAPNHRYGYPTTSWVSTSADRNAIRGRMMGKVIEYDSVMNVTREASWNSATDTFTGVTVAHDVWGNATQVRDPDNHLTSMTYDAYGFIATIQNPLNQVVTKTINPRFGLETRSVDENGVMMRTTLDGFGRITELEGPDPTGALLPVERYYITQDPNVPGVVLVTQKRDRWTSSSPWSWSEIWRDAFGREIKRRERGLNGNAILTEKKLDLAGRVTDASLERFEGASPVWVKHEYDVFHRPTKTTHPLAGVVHRLDYVDGERRVIETSATGEVSEYVLTTRGKLASRTKDGIATDYEYDRIGRLTAVLDHASETETLIYWDSLGRRIRIEDTNVGTRELEYDATGHLVREVDAEGNTITRTYDALDRTLLKTVTDSHGSTETTFIYDDTTLSNSIGRLSRVTQQRFDLGHIPSGSTTAYQFAYDRYGREAVTSMTIDGATYAFGKVYDPQGRTVELTYPDSSKLRSAYASNNRLYKLDLHDPVTSSGFQEYARWANFQANGQPGRVSYRNNVVSDYTYYSPAQNGGHGLGPALRQIHTYNSAASTELQRYEYVWVAGGPSVDEIFDLLNPTYTQKFHYDPSGRLVSTQASYGARSFSYDEVGAYRGNNMVIMSDGTTSYHRSFDGQKLVGEVYTDGVANYTSSFTYDRNGNMLTKEKGGHAYSYRYDGEDRLLAVQKDGALAGEFEYDFAGNRMKKVDPNGVVTLYIGSNYEITHHPATAMSPAQTLHTKYLEGPAGKLVSITHPESAVSALITQNNNDLGAGLLVVFLRLFDRLGSMISRDVAAAAVLTAIAAFVLLFLAQLLRGARTALLARRPGLALATPVAFAAFVGATGCGTSENVWSTTASWIAPGPNGAGYPENGTFYFHHSHVNSATLVTNTSGAQVARIEYEPFGRINTTHSSGADNFRAKFGGKEYDTGADLYYFGSRYYDPDIQRFLTPDHSIGTHPLHHASLHRYAYASNNPVTYADPSGQNPIIAFIAAVAIGAVIGGLAAGTDGKIFSDPGNAFKDFNWEAAAMGAFIGAAIGMMSYGIGSIGTPAVGGATLWNVPVGEYLSKAFNSAAVGTLQHWSSGMRDANRLGAYFGASFMGGLISTTGFFGLDKAADAKGFGGKLANQVATSMTSSLMKMSVDKNAGIQLSIWAFNVSFGDETKVEVDKAFLAGQGVAFLNNLVSGGLDRVKEGIDWHSLSMTSEGGHLGFALSWLPKSYGNGGKLEMKNITETLKTVMKGTADYAAPHLEGVISDPFKFNVGSALDKGVNKGADKLKEVFGPNEKFFQ